jgi:hypothetical protein
MQVLDKSGERGRNRTYNLLIKSQLLCQLSYAPTVGIWLVGRTKIIAFIDVFSLGAERSNLRADFLAFVLTASHCACARLHPTAGMEFYSTPPLELGRSGDCEFPYSVWNRDMSCGDPTDLSFHGRLAIDLPYTLFA